MAAMPDSTALGKLLEAVIKEAAAAAAAAAATALTAAPEAMPGPSPLPSTSPQLLRLDSPPAADPAAVAVAAALHALVPPAVWRDRADASLALSDRLLVQVQRRLPPLPALRGLLLFLRQQQHQDGARAAPAGAQASDDSGGGCDGEVLADAAALTAMAWGDAAAVQRLSPAQQAYLTAALCSSLALLERRQLDRHPRLLQLLLRGVTTRLDSPMQVGWCGCVKEMEQRVAWHAAGAARSPFAS